MRIEQLSPATAPDYRALTFPAYQSLLSGGDTVAFGAGDVQPVGLVLAQPLAGKNMLEVRSLFVTKPNRNQGIASQLVRALVSEANKRGYDGLRIQYRAPKPALERVLEKTGWTAPAAFVTTYRTDARIRTTPLLDFEFEADDRYELFAWPDLKATERPDIDALLEREPLPSRFVSPWLEADRIEPLNSVGVRYAGRVVGWSLTHRLDAQTIRYSGIFVHPDHRGLKGMGVGLRLLIASVQRHLPYAETTIPYAVFAVRRDNTFMPSIVQRYLAPYAFEMQEMRYAAHAGA